MVTNTFLVYIDTSVISRILDQRIKLDDAAALEALGHRKDVELVVSRKVAEETSRTRDPVTGHLLGFAATRFGQLPWRVTDVGGALNEAPLNTVPLGGSMPDPLFSTLSRIFEKDDAEHVFQAIRTRCSFFLTLDRTTILERVAACPLEINRLCGSLRFVSPVELRMLMQSQSPASAA